MFVACMVDGLISDECVFLHRSWAVGGGGGVHLAIRDKPVCMC